MECDVANNGLDAVCLLDGLGVTLTLPQPYPNPTPTLPQPYPNPNPNANPNANTGRPMRRGTTAQGSPPTYQTSASCGLTSRPTRPLTSCGCLWSSVELRAYFEAHASPAQLKMPTG